ncbi:MAG TPA: GNAT family N-acetyltransferase [Conexibacter sp.]|nr:GNAT family N-acetyltransferase [Conexibacter sp.]
MADASHSPLLAPLLRGPRVTLRPMTDDDVPALVAMLNEPEVARWWGKNDAADVREELAEAPSYAILVDDDAVVGWLQVHEEAEPQYPSVSFDIALRSALHGQGYGPEALRLAIRHQIERGHHRFMIDPALENERAIRAYEAVGFRRVGVLREYEMAPDGRRRDGLMMDLLARELVE